METYELYATIQQVEPGIWEWGIGQYIETGDVASEFEFLAGGREDSKDEAALRVSEEIKTLF